jgi:hypothetical protein
MNPIPLAENADVVFLLGGMVLNIFAGLALADSDTVFPVYQSAGYATVLGVMALTYADMGMYLSALSFGIGMLIWFGISLFRSPE